MADETTTEATSVAEETLTIYNSQPIMRLSVGEFEFKDGILKLSAEQAEVFDSILASMPLIERNRVVKIDLEAANELISQLIPAATQNNDSSAGRAALLQLQEAAPKHGTKPVDTPAAKP